MSSFTSYYFTCNVYGHKERECRMRYRKDNVGSHRNHAYAKDVSRSRYMHVPSPGYANIVCHNYNGSGHGNFECRKRNLLSHGGWQNGHALQKSENGAYGRQRPAWNQRRYFLARVRGPLVPIANQSNMTRRRWSNRYEKRFPKHEVGIDVVCYYITISNCNAKTKKERAHHQKKANPAPKSESGEKNEIKQVWRKKTLDHLCAFNA